jgi:hypothetical protein
MMRCSSTRGSSWAIASGMRIRDRLDRPRLAGWAALVGVLLALPALGHGLLTDDHWLRANLTRDARLSELWTAPWDIFTFFPERARGPAGIDLGYATWWAQPGGYAHYLRPLSSLTHWLDFRLWPQSPARMHLHSALWYGALCAIAAALYRRALAGWAAGLAALFYVTDYTHGMVAAWLANRNALVAGTFGLAALLLHDRAHDADRAEGRAVFRASALLCFGAALASGEVALGAAGYLLAHALFLERGGLAAKLRALAPYFVAGAGWAALYVHGRYGVVGSGLYLDPRMDVLAFARALPVHLALQLAAELGGPGPDLWPLLTPQARAGTLALAGAVVTLAAFALAPLLRRDAHARFLGTGALFSLLPFCATFPSSRLMLLPGFGLVGLVALAFTAWRDGADWLPAPALGGLRRRVIVAFAVLAGGVHLVLSPLVYLVMVHQSAAVQRVVDALADGLPGDPTWPQKQLVLVNSPDLLFTFYLRATLATHGHDVPGWVTMLGMGTHELLVSRRDATTLVLRDAQGFYGDGFSMLLRPEGIPMRTGERVETRVMSAVVEDTRAGVPTGMAFHFAAPLEDASLRWMAWDGTTFVPFLLPAPGVELRLPPKTHPLSQVP